MPSRATALLEWVNQYPPAAQLSRGTPPNLPKSVTCRRRNERVRRGPSVRVDWTNQGRVLRRLGEPNADRAHGPPRPAGVPRSAPRGGSSQSHDLLRAFLVAYRSDIPVRPATFGTLRFPSILSGLRPNDVTKIAQPKRNQPNSKGTTQIETGQYP